MNALETKVLELIGELPEAPDVFTDDDEGMAPIRDSLNDAIQEVVMLTGSKKATYYLPLRQGQMFYRFALNDGYLGWVTDAWSYNQRYRLEQTDTIKLSKYDPRWMVSSGEPRSYFQLGADVIGFWPKPASDSNMIELTIVQIPKPYASDTDRVNVREDYQHAVVNYAVSDYWASRGDAQQAESYLTVYLQAMGIRSMFTSSKDRAARFTTHKEPWPKETG